MNTEEQAWLYRHFTIRADEADKRRAGCRAGGPDWFRNAGAASVLRMVRDEIDAELSRAAKARNKEDD